jgi:hypothetical protein
MMNVSGCFGWNRMQQITLPALMNVMHRVTHSSRLAEYGGASELNGFKKQPARFATGGFEI